jgi:hypothetical protein
MAELSDNDLINAIGNNKVEREDWGGRLGEMREIIAAPRIIDFINEQLEARGETWKYPFAREE